jgi:hypothetical protein
MKMYKADFSAGLFIYNFEVVTRELMIGKQVSVAAQNSNDDFVLLSGKDNMLRLCALAVNNPQSAASPTFGGGGMSSPYDSHGGMGGMNQQQSAPPAISEIKVLTEISNVMNSRFPIRPCISPDGRYILSGCESGKLFMYYSNNGSHVEHWEAGVNVRRSIFCLA